MVNKVRSRPNHYELLGLAPAAESADVHRAFVAKMSSFGSHSIEEAAQFLVAYETLRDAGKRRDYDASLGLFQRPQVREWSIAVTPPRWSPFMVPVPTNEGRRKAKDFEHLPEPHVSAESLRKVAAEPAAARACAQWGPEERKAPRPFPAPRPRTQPERSPRSVPREDLETVLGHIREAAKLEKEKLRHAGGSPSDWRRAALALGGLVVGAGALGTLAGISAQDKAGAAEAQPAARTAHRAIKQDPALLPPPASMSAATGAQQPDWLGETPASRLRTRTPAIRQSHRPKEQTGESSAATRLPANDGAENVPVQPDPQPAQAVAADLPVSPRLIARTIERIGYSCGEVSSAEPVEGRERGVYRITCSSGQTYQAAPVQGRYRFRRLGS